MVSAGSSISKTLTRLRVILILVLVSATLFAGVGECRKKRKSRPKKDASMFIIAEGLYRDGFYDVAINQLKKFLKGFPKSKNAEKAKFLIGESYYLQKKYEKAEKLYREFIETYPESKIIDNVWFRLADCAYSTGDNEKAIENYTKIMDNFPESKLLDDAYYWTGESLYQLKKYEKSISVFESFLDKFPKDPLEPNVLERLGKVNFALKKLKRSIHYYELLYKNYQSSSLLKPSLPKLADAYYKEKRYLSAGEVFENILFKFPENENIPHYTFYCGISYLKANIYECATKYLDMSIPLLKERKKNILEKNIRFSHGVVVEDELKMIQKNIENAMYHCGNIYFRMSKFNEALSSYQRLISEYPQSIFIPGVLYNSGLCFLEMDKPNEGLLYFRKLTKEFPENDFSTDAYLRSGVIYMRKKDYQSSISMFKKALRVASTENTAELKYYLGESYLKTNNFKSALKSYQEVIDIKNAKNSLIEMSNYRVAEIYLKQEKISEAQKIYKRLLATVKSSELKKLVKMRIVDINDFKKNNLK